MSQDPVSGQALTDAELREAIERCDREPIHIPGTIQPHGYLLGLDEQRTVRFVSANCVTLFERELADLIGLSASVLFAEQDLEGLEQALAGALAPVRYREVQPRNGRGSFHAVMHRSGPGLILELEPAGETQASGAPSPQDLFARAAQFATRLQQVESQHQLQAYVVNEVRALTGFDRVKLYRFDEDWNGEVIAESRATHMVSYEGMRFPASDIPRQARTLYARNFLRLIPNVSYAPVALVPGDRWPSESEQVDLTHSVLRAVSPVHLEYLANMQVAASMSISVMQNEKLWGLIACHHSQPLHVPYPMRMVAELLGHTFSAVLSNSARHAAQTSTSHREATVRELTAALSPDESLLKAMKSQHQKMLDAVDADGMILRVSGKYLAFGQIPEVSFTRELIAWLEAHHDKRVFVTDSIARDTALITAAQPFASGVLAVPVSASIEDYVMWFREEQSEQVNWAGRPEKRISRDAAGFHLSPRASFGRWRQVIRGRSRPWEPMDITLGTRIADIVLGKRQEASLRQARYDFRSVLDNANAYILITDPLGNIISLNSRTVEEFGLDGPSITGKPLGEVLPEEFASALDEHRETLRREPQAVSFAVSFRSRSCNVHLIASQFPLYDAYDEIYAICSIANDISELRATQLELEHANTELEQFAYIASHDLRAPMRSIDSLAEWIAEDLQGQTPEEATDKLDMLRGRVQRLEALLDDILLYSRVGKMKEAPREVDVGALLREVIAEVAAPEDFTISVAPEMPTLQTAATPLRQIFGNLISNAVKHHDKIAGTIEIAAADSTNDEVTFSVTDDGPGIDPRYHERVFKMFQTLKSRDVVEGSGLGLSIVQKLVRWQGGRCWIDSQAGRRGTGVHFTWPRHYQTKGASGGTAGNRE
ncbi:MAG: ATP-binding protein [Pseudomonadota bacterium]